MRLRRYEAWILIDDGDGEPLEKMRSRCFTRRGAQSLIDSILGDLGLNVGLLMAKVHHDIDIKVAGEVRKIA